MRKTTCSKKICSLFSGVFVAAPAAIGTNVMCSRPASAVVLCGQTDALDFSGIPILPFGGEYIGIGPEGGEIVGASYEVTFTTEGDFDAANIGCYLVESVGAGPTPFGFNGVDLGWSGQGTFRASLQDSSALNGYLNSFGNPYTTFFLEMVNLDVGAGPIQGTFDVLIFHLEFAPCPAGDVNHDASVNIDDLFLVINNWGACPNPPDSCPADVDGSGGVDVDDLFAVINNWGDFCANCK